MSDSRDITLSTGKKLTIQRPDVLAQYRLVAALGDLAENRVYLAMTLPLMHLTAIDGEVVPQPRTHREVEALISRLGGEGVKALHDAVAEHAAESEQNADAARKSLPIQA